MSDSVKSGSGGAATTAAPINTPMTPPPTGVGVGLGGGPSKDFASRHRVKKLLETYHMTAERSLMGPDHHSSTDSDHGGLGFQHPKYFSAKNPPSASYKLPPDVELCRTSSPPPDLRGGIKMDPNDPNPLHKVDLAATKRLHMQMAAAAAMAAGLKGGGGGHNGDHGSVVAGDQNSNASPPVNGLATAAALHLARRSQTSSGNGNGQVTLSRSVKLINQLGKKHADNYLLCLY